MKELLKRLLINDPQHKVAINYAGRYRGGYLDLGSNYFSVSLKLDDGWHVRVHFPYSAILSITTLEDGDGAPDKDPFRARVFDDVQMVGAVIEVSTGLPYEYSN